jgi:uncharacterized membrane protein
VQTALRLAHVSAVVVYLGGGLLLHLSFRRALHLVPPAQAAVLASRVGTHFTIVSWLALAIWGVSGYWLLARSGMADFSSPATLFVHPAITGTGLGWSLLIMIGAWYLLLASAATITFVLRPRLTRRLEPNASEEEAGRMVASIARAARGIDILAMVNLVLATVAFVAAKMYF